MERAGEANTDVQTAAARLAEARALGVAAKPVLLGPLSLLWLGKSKDGSDRLALLPALLDAAFERPAAS